MSERPAGRTVREAALRELIEESGQRPDDLGFAGVARVWYAKPTDALGHLLVQCQWKRSCERALIDREVLKSGQDRSL